LEVVRHVAGRRHSFFIVVVVRSWPFVIIVVFDVVLVVFDIGWRSFVLEVLLWCPVIGIVVVGVIVVVVVEGIVVFIRVNEVWGVEIVWIICVVVFDVMERIVVG